MPDDCEVVIGGDCWICHKCNRVWPEEVAKCLICGMESARCVECGTLLELDELKHIWMEYDPDFLDDDDEKEEYIGLMCESCIVAASEIGNLPIIDLDLVDYFSEQGDEEEIS
jgi:hypothetical protein